MKLDRITAACLLAIAAAPAAYADAPTYTIIDLGVVGNGTSSQAFGISPNGVSIVGRQLSSTGYPATLWTQAAGQTALSNLAGRSYAMGRSVNDAGLAVGISATTAFGSSPLPVAWQNGSVSALALPAGQTVGQAYGVNASGMIVGAAGSGVGQRGVIYSLTGAAQTITATTANGSFMGVAFGVNNSGLVVGTGIDPNNAAVNVGMVYNSVTGVMGTVGALPGANGALNYAVSNTGYVVGSSMLNQGSGMPFIWTASGGMVGISLPANTSQGSAQGVNDLGWAVGTAGGQFAVPFLYIGGTTYTLADLLPANSGWDLQTNTSSSALGITNDGTIIGTAVHNGQTHAYAMVMAAAVPEPEAWALMLAGLGVVGGVARRRRSSGR